MLEGQIVKSEKENQTTSSILTSQAIECKLCLRGTAMKIIGFSCKKRDPNSKSGCTSRGGFVSF
jgi:hypothetical protein